MTKRFYKKNYKGINYEKIFGLVLSLVIVISTNIISRTFNISNQSIFVLCITSIVVLNTTIIVKILSIKKSVNEKKSSIISSASQKYFELAYRYSFVTFIPIVFLVYVRNENTRYFLLLVSVWILALVKYYFDNIISHNMNGYTSGFDNIVIDSTTDIEIEKERNFLCIGEVVQFCIYRNGEYYGYDKFCKEEYMLLCNRITKRKPR